MSDAFVESVKFSSFELKETVLKGLDALQWVHPTKIQAEMIPPALLGKDVIGQAKTGTGKTAAFGVPILNNADENTPMQALILVPTRELANQVASELETLGRFTPIRTTCIIGGESMREQVRSIQRGGHIIVGTPGRIMDMNERREISFDKLRFVVLDEVDRMLDIGFREDIRRILRSIKQEHQTMFVSATMDKNIEQLSRQFMSEDALKISTTGGVLTVSMVEQKYISVEPWDKLAMLKHLLKVENPDTTIVFCRTKATVHKVAESLRKKGIEAREIHGDMHQSKRNRVMTKMREKNLPVLIASDLAARGLDIDHITHVINYDLPDDPEIYIHRIGRTARAGRKGSAFAFVTPEQGVLLSEIEKLAGILMDPQVYDDFKPGRVPKDISEERNREQQRLDARSKKPSAKRVGAETNELSKEELAKMFPGGVIPTKKLRAGIGSKLRTRRSR